MTQPLQLKKLLNNRDKELAGWIDANVGVSSQAIYLYMTTNKIPRPFDAPSDESDRNRCIVLLRARPEWIDRLKEIEDLKIEGTRNEEKVMPWNEQIPLILQSITKSHLITMDEIQLKKLYEAIKDIWLLSNKDEKDVGLRTIMRILEGVLKIEE